MSCLRGSTSIDEKPKRTNDVESAGRAGATMCRAHAPPTFEWRRLRHSKPNPTEVFINSERDIVQRSLVFRNTSGKDFVLKLIASNRSAILFPTTLFRFPPHSYRTIQFRVDTRHVSTFDIPQIRGFVLPVYSKQLRQWIDRKDSAECPTQEAFCLSIKLNKGFSAPLTVVNLPGNATCIDAVDHPVDVEELDTITAVNIESDVVTAEPIGNMMAIVEAQRKKTADNSCWLSGIICGGPTPNAEPNCDKSKSTSRGSCKSQSRRNRPNTCLDAAPCAGSS
ncbi:unnamed protein product [Caenorhabditis bovis]|uniref:Major sperm protein n=1 Tax=Caenorhabditis bovis TaxID=2654633 RepID=A0A8S1EZE0_9PELO|nr:unnamed protein product [Caenorhabditis bovis]